MSEIKKVEGDKKSDPLSSFMKKQMVEKAQNNAANKVSASSGQSQQNKIIKKDAKKDLKKDKEKDDKDDEKKDDQEEEMTEEEKALEEAKKASRNKAAERDQTEMYKKLLKETLLKYTIVLSVLGVLSIAIIKAGPAIISFFRGGLTRALMAAIGQ